MANTKKQYSSYEYQILFYYILNPFAELTSYELARKCGNPENKTLFKKYCLKMEKTGYLKLINRKKDDKAAYTASELLRKNIPNIPKQNIIKKQPKATIQVSKILSGDKKITKKDIKKYEELMKDKPEQMNDAIKKIIDL